MKQTRAEAGITVQQAAAATVIEESFLASSAAVPLPADVVQAEITDEEADQVADNYAKPAVSAPVKVKAGEAGTFKVSPAMIAAALTFVAGERHAGAGPRRREVAGAAPTPRSRRSS